MCGGDGVGKKGVESETYNPRVLSLVVHSGDNLIGFRQLQGIGIFGMPSPVHKHTELDATLSASHKHSARQGIMLRR